MQASISNRIRSFLIGSGIRFVNETRLRIKRSAAWFQKTSKLVATDSWFQEDYFPPTTLKIAWPNSTGRNATLNESAMRLLRSIRNVSFWRPLGIRNWPGFGTICLATLSGSDFVDAWLSPPSLMGWSLSQAVTPLGLATSIRVWPRPVTSTSPCI